MPRITEANSPEEENRRGRSGVEGEAGGRNGGTKAPSSTSVMNSGAVMRQGQLHGMVTGEGGEMPVKNLKKSPKELKRRGEKVAPPGRGGDLEG